MEWNTLIAVGGTLLGTGIGSYTTIWLRQHQSVSEKLKWEKDQKLIEYTRVLQAYTSAFACLQNFIVLKRETRENVHDTLNDAHQSTLMLLAPEDVVRKYNKLYKHFVTYLRGVGMQPTQEKKDEFKTFLAGYIAIRRELAQSMRTDLDLSDIDFASLQSEQEYATNRPADM